MSLRCAIVGLPNVGKSTLFNTLTKAQKAEASNYPFCTIEPNNALVSVPDERLDKIAEIIKPDKIIPVAIEFVDVAGLVKGASKGEGLGNKFLSHIQETDAILHVVRCFSDSNITHVENTIDPLRDIEIIETELLLSDLEKMEKRFAKVDKNLRVMKSKELEAEIKVLEKVLTVLKKGQFASKADLRDDEKFLIKSLGLLTLKPMIYVCNTSEDEKDVELFNKVKKMAHEKSFGALSMYVHIESEISLLEESEQKEFLDSLNLEESGLNRLIKTSYDLLNLQSFFTAGKQEVRAWTISKSEKAPGAAGKIHSDFEKGFIKAETYHCEDLFELKSVSKIKEAGKYRIEGKDYIVKDGDVLFFKFNV